MVREGERGGKKTCDVCDVYIRHRTHDQLHYWYHSPCTTSIRVIIVMEWKNTKVCISQTRTHYMFHVSTLTTACFNSASYYHHQLSVNCFVVVSTSHTHHAAHNTQYMAHNKHATCNTQPTQDSHRHYTVTAA